MMLAWYFDKVVPGEYGVKKPWNFVCQPCANYLRTDVSVQDEKKEEVIPLVLNTIPDAKVKENTPNQICFILPLQHVSLFPTLLSSIDEKIE